MMQKVGWDFLFDPTACSLCKGRCCTGESGYIWTTRREIREIASFLQVEVDVFRKKYMIDDGHGSSLSEVKIGPNNYACVFFDTEKNGCSIYPVRPEQCRTFPFWDHFKRNIKEVVQECPGIYPLKK